MAKVVSEQVQIIKKVASGEMSGADAAERIGQMYLESGAKFGSAPPKTPAQTARSMAGFDDYNPIQPGSYSELLAQGYVLSPEDFRLITQAASGAMDANSSNP